MAASILLHTMPLAMLSLYEMCKRCRYNLISITLYYLTHMPISGCLLRVDPRDRPTISDVVSQLQQVAVARGVNLKAALELQPTSKDELQRELSFTAFIKAFIYLNCLKFFKV